MHLHWLLQFNWNLNSQQNTVIQSGFSSQFVYSTNKRVFVDSSVSWTNTLIPLSAQYPFQSAAQTLWLQRVGGRPNGRLTDLLSWEGEGDIIGWRSGQVWPSCQGPLHPEQKMVWQVWQDTAEGWPSVLGCTLHTAWHSNTGHHALLGSSFTPAGNNVDC